MNAEQFNDALQKAKHGERVAYHSGLLMRDRLYNVEVDARAKAAWKAHEEGFCALVQRRVDANTCQYLAVRLDH